jgi:quinol monooxygenase YgiN
MSKITVVAKFVTKQETIELLKHELLKLITPTRQEPGCIEYRLHQDNQDPAVFLFYENWENMSFLERHMKSSHFQAFSVVMKSLVTEQVIHIMTELD